MRRSLAIGLVISAGPSISMRHVPVAPCPEPRNGARTAAINAQSSPVAGAAERAPAGVTPWIASLDRACVTVGALASGQAVIVSITGTRFDPMANTVLFGRFDPTNSPKKFAQVTITGVPSAMGSRIAFTVPNTVPTRGGSQLMSAQPGLYTVSVETGHGTSNAVLFRILP